jgi:hypothetical protein
MGQMYSVTFDAVATTAQSDLFELNVASTRAVRLHSVFVGQSSDFGDAQSELLKLQIIIGHATSGSGGSAPTPSPLAGGPASASTVEANNTTIASTGTTKTLHQDTWNVMVPYQYRPTPEERLEFAPSSRVVIRLPAPADSLTLSGTMVFEEIGG